MVKLNSKKRVAVFISGRGSNLKNLNIFSKKRNSKFIISLVISNKKNAKGIVYAKKNKILCKIIDDIKNFEKKALLLIKLNKINLLCLAGFMKVLSSYFIKNVGIPIINIHPSLLPKFKGLNTHQRAIDAREEYSGCTVHYVNNKLDSGKIILQKKVKILKKDTAKSLANKIQKEEHKIFSKALNSIC